MKLHMYTCLDATMYSILGLAFLHQILSGNFNFGTQWTAATNSVEVCSSIASFEKLTHQEASSVESGGPTGHGAYPPKYFPEHTILPFLLPPPPLH